MVSVVTTCPHLQTVQMHTAAYESYGLRFKQLGFANL
jgi:hypothetical protein